MLPQGSENCSRHLTNNAYGKNESTIILYASRIVFIVNATNYRIMSLMTHFSVS